MGSFYGDKGVATASTNLTFDKIYSSFWSVKVNAAYDNIYYGRNVLIEYGGKNADSSNNLGVEDIYLPVYVNANSGNTEDAYLYDKLVYSDEKNHRILYGGEINDPSETRYDPDAGINNIVKQDQVVKVLRNGIEYWVCIDGIIEDDIAYAKFEQLCTGDTVEYYKNRAIDCYHEAPSKDSWDKYGIDYDSTVWQRVDFGVSGSGFVNIATLNAVFPTFTTGAEAPSIIPEAPHFSWDSGGSHYQLRTQPSWGMRVAEAANTNNSDAQTTWTYYDDNGNLRTTTKNAAIYFNKKALDPQLNQPTINGVVNGIDEIKIAYDGKSGKQYLQHNSNSKVSAVDTQQISINLPSIGNAVAKVYDVLYGPKRDSSAKDSLAGYLNVFQNLGSDKIPVGAEDGVLIGASLTGDGWINTSVDTNKILINHKTPAAMVEEDNKFGTEENATIKNGGNFNIPSFAIDSKGHIKGGIKNTTITLPTISLGDPMTKGNVLTGLVLTPDTMTFVPANANVGTLALTEYVADENDILNSNLTINGAFYELSSQLRLEMDEREALGNNVELALEELTNNLSAEYAAADAALQTDLEGQLDTRAINLTNDYTTKISDETTKRTNADSNLNARIDAESQARQTAISAETTERTKAIAQEKLDRAAAIIDAIGALDVSDAAVDGQYVSQVVETDGKIAVSRAALPDYSAKYDANTQFTYNETQMTINTLFTKVAELEARIAALETPTV